METFPISAPPAPGLRTLKIGFRTSVKQTLVLAFEIELGKREHLQEKKLFQENDESWWGLGLK